MKRIAFFALAAVMAVAVAASPAEAAKKKKQVRQAQAVLPVGADTNEASARLFVNSLPIFMPSWGIWLYVKGTGRDW